ncbi:MAG TPA: hypothetical protein VEF33_09915 [Syntrophales bacterium]|nr:hypothetical protein [Syntrophales bacterium]
MADADLEVKVDQSGQIMVPGSISLVPKPGFECKINNLDKKSMSPAFP